MPSPFPGMDPYLEAPGRWPDVHHEIISQVREQLNRLLRPKYYARIEDRVYVSDEYDPGRTVIVPDIRVIAGEGKTRPSLATDGHTALEVAEPVVVTTLIEDEIHEARVEIIDSELRSVVTVIEVLSPSNKVPGSRGRASFEQKRREVMTSPTHWVEIDLLRTGEPMFARELVPPCEYFVHVSEVARRPRGKVWPIRLVQRLPKIAIPLKPEDAPASLDLQEVLDLAYDRAGYDMDINYQAEPVPPLDADWSRWADRLLREKGKRTGEAPGG